MYEKNMAQDNKVPEQNKKCQKLKGWSAEGQRKQKEKKKSEYRTNGIERF